MSCPDNAPSCPVKAPVSCPDNAPSCPVKAPVTPLSWLDKPAVSEPMFGRLSRAPKGLAKFVAKLPALPNMSKLPVKLDNEPGTRFVRFEVILLRPPVNPPAREENCPVMLLRLLPSPAVRLLSPELAKLPMLLPIPAVRLVSPELAKLLMPVPILSKFISPALAQSAVASLPNLLAVVTKAPTPPVI